MKRVLIIALLCLVVTATAVFYRSNVSEQSANISDTISETLETNLLPIAPDRTPYPQTELQAAAFNRYSQFFGASERNLIEPVEGFQKAITKKPFSIYITPQTSPVRPDKFTGYHTGVDSEFTDTTEEVPVRAIADGTIIVQTWSSGYGGVIVIKHTINGINLYALYGHLDPESFTASAITKVKAGDQIGVLGDGHSEETDGARKHLHFAIYTGEKIDFRGYVLTVEELNPWLNPLDLYRANSAN